MRTLLIEPTPAGSATVAGDLEAAGHDVVRCHPSDGPAFPCAGLTHDGCPLEGALPVDVAIAVRDEPGDQPRADESGVTCALRTGIPVVVIGPGDHPFEEWAETCGDTSELPEAVERAVAATAARRAEPMLAEALRILGVEGIDAGQVRVEIERDGDIAHVMIRTERPVPTGLANTIATRAHAVDSEVAWPTKKLAIAFGPLN